jgi:hypothetical protein
LGQHPPHRPRPGRPLLPGADIPTHAVRRRGDHPPPQPCGRLQPQPQSAPPLPAAQHQPPTPSTRHTQVDKQPPRQARPRRSEPLLE